MNRLIKYVETPEEREAAYAIRMTVFVEEQNIPPWEEIDAEDETAYHLLALVDSLPVGTARILSRGGEIGKIGRVAVLAEHRKTGVGRELMSKEIDHCSPAKNRESCQKNGRERRSMAFIFSSFG